MVAISFLLTEAKDYGLASKGSIFFGFTPTPIWTIGFPNNISLNNARVKWMIVKHLAVFHFLPGLQTLLTQGLLQISSSESACPLLLLTDNTSPVFTLPVKNFVQSHQSGDISVCQWFTSSVFCVGAVMVQRSCTAVFVLCRPFITGTLIHGPLRISFPEWIKSRILHLPRPFFKIFADCDIQPHIGNWASRGSEHLLSVAQEVVTQNCLSSATFISLCRRKNCSQNGKQKCFSFYSFPRHGCTHTQRGAGSPEQQLEFPPEHIQAGIEEAEDCQGKQIFWIFLKLFLILQSPWLLLVLLSCCVRT